MTEKKTWKVVMEPAAEAVWNNPKGELTNDDRIVISSWARTVRDEGPDELQKHPGIWRDHLLIGGFFNGCRASSFSHSGRLIYYKIDDLGIVTIIRITTDHDYSKEGKND